MKKSVVFLFVAILVFMLSGCILSKTPSTNSVAMSFNEQKTFSVNVFPPATYTWTLNEVPLSNTEKSYVYTAQAGDHILTVKATHFLGTDTQTWNIQTPEASNIAIKVLPEENAIIAADADGNVMVNRYNEKAITWTFPDTSESLAIYYNDNFLPTKLVFNNCVVLFDNWTSSTVDIAIISPDKPYSIIRGLSLDYDVIASINSIISSSSKILSKSISAISVPDPEAFEETAKAFKLTSKIVSVALCTGTVAAAIVSAGVGVPAMVLACTSTVLTFIEVASGSEWVGYANDAWGIISCDDGGCILTLMSLSGTALELAGSILTDLKTLTNNAQQELNPITALLSSMVYIPGGSFMMGSTDNEYGWAQCTTPVHQVTLQAFDIGAYEVTQAQYLAVMGTNPSYFQGTSYPGSENNPVEWVTWYDARAFCTALSALTGRTFTLPSEAQWEYACRAGTTTLYNYGNSDALLDNYAWWYSNSVSQTHPVGTKISNNWGLYDMMGNVYEWCLDSYHADYTGAPTDGSAWEPETGPLRMIRGGSWNNANPGNLRSAYRNNSAPIHGHSLIGFRVLAVR